MCTAAIRVLPTPLIRPDTLMLIFLLMVAGVLVLHGTLSGAYPKHLDSTRDKVI